MPFDGKQLSPMKHTPDCNVSPPQNNHIFNLITKTSINSRSFWSSGGWTGLFCLRCSEVKRPLWWVFVCWRRRWLWSVFLCGSHQSINTSSRNHFNPPNENFSEGRKFKPHLRGPVGSFSRGDDGWLTALFAHCWLSLACPDEHKHRLQQRRQTLLHRGPHQHHGRLLKGRCNWSAV